MRKKTRMILATTMMLSLSVLIGCTTPEEPGNTPAPTATTAPTTAPQDTPTPEPTATTAPQETLTPVPTATNTPVPTATNTPTPVPTATTAPTSTPTPEVSVEIKLTDTEIPGIYWREEYNGDEFGWPGEFMVIRSDGTIYTWIQSKDGSGYADVSKITKVTPYDSEKVDYYGTGKYLIYTDNEYGDIIIYSDNYGGIPFVGFEYDLMEGAASFREDSMPEGYYVPSNVEFEGDNPSVEEPTETPTPMPTATNTPVPTATNTPTPVPTATNTPTPVPTATNTPTPVPTATNTPTPVPTATNTPTPVPTATNTPVPTATNTPTPVPTEVPIVKVNGTVDAAAVQKVENAFQNLVVKMRADGLITATDICVEMDATEIRADITLQDEKKDLVLVKDADTGIYTLKLDYNFLWIWIDGVSVPVNGKDVSEYNKELLMAMLSVISDEPQALFDVFDQTYFGSYYLGDKSWTPVGDCYMMDGESVWGDFFAYKITKEPPVKTYTRDAVHTMSYTKSDGTVVEVVIEYDSSVVKFEDRISYLTGEPETCFDAVNMDVFEAFGCPELLSGCSSYEQYKDSLLNRLVNEGATSISYYPLGDSEVNGYQYYNFEAIYDGFMDPDIIYIQLPGDVYIEIFNVWFTCTLEEFANQVLYVKEVTVK